jgi:Protein of unknown function (DUF4058)
MPLHDWSKVEAGIFHDFHTVWIAEIRNVLNGGLLPAEFYALAEQHMGGFVADVLTLHAPPKNNIVSQTPAEYQSSGSIAVADIMPATKTHESVPREPKALQRTVAIRHVSSHRIVALLEIVSPSNKDREEHLEMFVQKTFEAIGHGIHVLVVDLFASSQFDPHGMHDRIRKILASYPSPYEIGSPRSTLASYQVTPTSVEMFVEHVDADARLPDMPIFLDSSRYINVPLDATYITAWQGMPAFWRRVINGATQ